MLPLLLSLACFRLLPGTVGMGAECSESSECVGEGTCLKGVCAGYACDTGGGCADDHECASVDGVQTCAMACASDDDCPGAMDCEPWDDGDYCI